MAAERPRFVANDSRGSSNQPLDPKYLTALAGRLGVNRALEVQETRGEYSLADTKGAFLSLLNLASVDELSKRLGEPLDPLRFRMNVHVRNLAPFEELNWVNAYPGTRIVKIGRVRFRVDDACERCLAICADPATGLADRRILQELQLMMRGRGYVSPHRKKSEAMGILLAPLNNGVIWPGDRVTVES
jgi:uncharacterized protein YcbX